MTARVTMSIEAMSIETKSNALARWKRRGAKKATVAPFVKPRAVNPGGVLRTPQLEGRLLYGIRKWGATICSGPESGSSSRVVANCSKCLWAQCFGLSAVESIAAVLYPHKCLTRLDRIRRTQLLLSNSQVY